jgi:hypothetical protein
MAGLGGTSEDGYECPPALSDAPGLPAIYPPCLTSRLLQHQFVALTTAHQPAQLTTRKRAIITPFSRSSGNPYCALLVRYDFARPALFLVVAGISPAPRLSRSYALDNVVQCFIRNPARLMTIRFHFGRQRRVVCVHLYAALPRSALLHFLPHKDRLDSNQYIAAYCLV